MKDIEDQTQTMSDFSRYAETEWEVTYSKDYVNLVH